MTQAEKLAALRAELKQQGVDGFLIPRADEYQGEYVPARAERLSWLTGFTGSAGMAVVLDDSAMVHTDSRYELQVAQQVDAALYSTTIASAAMSVAKWVADNAKAGQVIGYDPRLHTPMQIEDFEKELAKNNMTMKALGHNAVDAIWADQPGVPMNKVTIFPDYIAGRSAREKREEIAAKIVQENAVATVLTLPDSIAWLLNIRGTDVPHTPLALSNAIVYADGQVKWFIEAGKVTDEVHAHLGNHVQVYEPSSFPGVLTQVGKLSKDYSKPVMFDERRSSVWAKQWLESGGATIKNAEDPCILPKACKTPEEQEGMRNAHFRDGIAVTKFLAWLDREGTKQTLTELDVADKLEGFRKLDPTYKDTSFDTIAGWGPNGAIVHYRATPEKHSTILPPGILLLDSGGQYLNGTTDITRTIAIGEPNAEMKKAFTLVLKGHIAIADSVMPQGTKGADIDDRARKALQEHGMDYGHGTGHGVGCYLSVHEEGGGISSKAQRPYQPGMVISNEPGYYKAGEFGIRIENLVMVHEADDRNLQFETLTIVPIDKRLMDFDLMTDEEIAWMNEYHAKVQNLLMPHLDTVEKQWLKEATAPLKKPEAAVVRQAIKPPSP